MCFREGKLGCAAFGEMLLLEESGATLKIILCNPRFFVRSSRKVWFSNSRLYASGLDSSPFQSSPLEEAVRASTKRHFVSLDENIFDCFLSNNVPDYLVILPLSYRLFVFFCTLGKIF